MIVCNPMIVCIGCIGCLDYLECIKCSPRGASVDAGTRNGRPAHLAGSQPSQDAGERIAAGDTVIHLAVRGAWVGDAPVSRVGGLERLRVRKGG